MRKIGVVLWLIGPLSIVIVTISIGLCVLFGAMPSRRDVCRELRPEEIGPILQHMIGRALPSNAKDLRGIYCQSDLGAAQQVFLAFRSDPQGYSQVMESFAGQGVRREEFPREKNEPYLWEMIGFQAGCRHQKELGIVLFDEQLIDRVRTDAMKYAINRVYPNDAVTGYYLASSTNSTPYYWILIFKDLGIIYVVVSYV